MPTVKSSKESSGEREQNYLDTDIILALTKKEDWLKAHVSLAKMMPACTSVFTILEARLVLEREYGRTDALKVLEAIKEFNLTLLPLTEAVLQKSQELLREYPSLNHFDSVHVAFALLHNYTIIGTDTIFAKIAGLRSKDPRAL